MENLSYVPNSSLGKLKLQEGMKLSPTIPPSKSKKPAEQRSWGIKSKRTKELLGKIEEIRPKTEKDLSRAGIKYRQIGFGSFRTTYRITGYDVVIKFPNQDTLEGEDEINAEHTRMEYRRIKRIEERLPFMKQHMPSILYYDAKNGVIVMEYVSGRHMLNSVENGCVNQILRKAFKAAGVTLDDGWGDNVIIARKRKNGYSRKAVIVDVGY